MRILLIEDDRRLLKNLQRMLAHEGWTSDAAETAEEGLGLVEIEEYDLTVLDWMLPDASGPTVCHDLRKAGYKGPVLFLTAKSEIEDKVRGLESGADDYLTKPFAKDELLARIRALMRRKTGDPDPIITIEDLELNTNTHEVKRAGKSIELAPREYSLLEFLMFNRNKALDRFAILNHVWGEDVDGFSNTVDVHIRYLRKKIDEGYKARLIQTVKGKGYMICDDNSRKNKN